LDGVDCVLDGLDNVYTRYLINETCVKNGIPYIYAAAIGIEGYLSCFNHPETPCFSCIFPNLDDRNIPTCETRGVLGATTGIIGAMEAMETVKLLAGFGEVLKGILLVCDFYDMTSTRIEIVKNPECEVCGKAELPKKVETTERLVWLCGQNTVNINPTQPFDINFNEVHNQLGKKFKILLKSSLAVVFKHNSAEVSLFKGGRMLIKHVNTEEEALKIYRSVTKQLEIKNNQKHYYNLW
jgi:adenylyltransferase/sulfurtransferase